MSLASFRIIRKHSRKSPLEILKDISLATRLGYTEEQELMAKAQKAQQKINFRLNEIRRQQERNAARLLKIKRQDSGGQFQEFRQNLRRVA
jgi:hypothetical protein